MALALTKRRKRINRMIARSLIIVLQRRYDSNAARVTGASLIVWMAAQQGIHPEDLDETEAEILFDSLAVLAVKSRDTEGLSLSADIGTTSLGRRWRQIRLKALEGLL